jgi:hypothetical protein
MAVTNDVPGTSQEIKTVANIVCWLQCVPRPELVPGRASCPVYAEWIMATLDYE